MKILVFSLLAIGTLALTSCKENKEQKSTTETSMQHDMSMMSDNSAMGDMPMDEKVTVIDAKKTSANLTELYSHYTHLTFALSGDDDKEAVNTAKGILEALPKINKKGFSAEQKKEYAETVITGGKGEKVGRIPNKLVFSDNVSLSDKVDSFFDKNFWEDYNIIEPDESLESAVNKLKKNHDNN